MEFEQRLLPAQRLEQNLVARKATVAPSPEPAIPSRYEPARRTVLDHIPASDTLPGDAARG